MITQATIRYVRSLEQKKFRNQHGCFVAEGDKIVREALASGLVVEQVFALPAWIEANGSLASGKTTEVVAVSEKELGRISMLKTPNQVLAVIRMPNFAADNQDLRSNLTLLLDDIQDPGNLGTIIRTADWFGVKNIYCSLATADVFNPKVIQATMGSFARVRVHYTPLTTLLEKMNDSIPVYGAFLQGDNLFERQASLPAVLIIGNESKGISSAIAQRINHRLRIPGGGNHSAHGQGAESLNASVAAAIIMAWFMQP
jgi:RNA methyltransferase, TrmH family